MGVMKSKALQPHEKIVDSLLVLKAELETKVPIGSSTADPLCRMLMKINSCLYTGYPRKL